MIKTTINGREYSRTKIRNNILKVWNTTTESDRQDWYQEANDWCRELAKSSPYTLEQVVGIVAALSPMQSWEKNQLYARWAVLEDCDISALPCLEVSKSKAERISLTTSITDIRGILNGPKTTAFFMNILCPHHKDYITIDRHAISIALGYRLVNAETGITARQYDFIKHCYAWTAEQLNVAPILLQSTTWVAWR